MTTDKELDSKILLISKEISKKIKDAGIELGISKNLQAELSFEMTVISDLITNNLSRYSEYLNRKGKKLNPEDILLALSIVVSDNLRRSDNG